MNVWATVVLPAYVTLEVPEGTPTNEIKEKILDQADLIWASSGIDPLIQDSSIPELIN